MSAFKLQTLKQKLWAIVYISITFRILSFLLVPKSPIEIIGDEGTYAKLASWIADSNPANEFQDYGEKLYLSSRSLILPASGLVRIGINELDSVRLVSSIYGLLSLLLIVTVFIQISRRVTHPLSSRNQKIVLGLVATFALMPSHFIWSVFGLRESSNEFWLIATYVSLYYFYTYSGMSRLIASSTLVVSIIFVFYSRTQVGWVLVISLFSVVILRVKEKTSLYLIPLVFIGMYSGFLSTSATTYTSQNVYELRIDATPPPTNDARPAPTNNATPAPTNDARPAPTNNATPAPTNDATPAPTNDATPAPTKNGCDDGEKTVAIDGVAYNCVVVGTKRIETRNSNPAPEVVDYVTRLPEKSLANQTYAASQFTPPNCPFNGENSIDYFMCLAWRAPYMALTFLFRPLPFIDTTSMSSTFAAAENILWIFMFAVIVYRIFNLKRIPLLRELAPTLVFFTLFVVGAGSYEGNMGTAFRHKSLILWVPLLLLLALFWQNDSRTKNSIGNNSQESAV